MSIAGGGTPNNEGGGIPSGGTAPANGKKGGGVLFADIFFAFQSSLRLFDSKIISN